VPKPSTITDLSAAITAGDGVARPNLFWVQFPNIGSSVSAREMGLMCREVQLPSRQITTVERPIGPVQTKVPYHHLTEAINMRFMVLNNASVRKYFEEWQNNIVPGANEGKDYERKQEVAYYNEFVRDITIFQLKKNFELSLFAKKFDFPIPNFVKNALRNSGGLTFDNDLFSLNIGVDGINAGLALDGNTSYKCELYDAYPISIQYDELSDDASNTFGTINVSFQFRNWSGASMEDNNPINKIRNEIEKGIGEVRDKVEDGIKSYAKKKLGF